MLTCRPATVKDITDLIVIHAEANAEVTTRLGPGPWSLRPTRMDILASMERRAVLVVLKDEEPVATVTTSPDPAYFWPRQAWAEPDAPALSVFGLAVRPSVQRQGVGAWTMRQVEEMARREGRRWVRLDAYVANPRSQAFYRKIGYLPRLEAAVSNTRVLCFEKCVESATD